VNRCSKILIVTVIILIMSGGILLTTNNIRDLQGMEKTHITINIPGKNVIASYIETVLEPGMVVSMEPCFTILEGNPGAGGYREHDILVIKENGEVENITGFPVGPEHNVIK
jgi:Xaa-Pro aminopeptidase